MSIDTLKSLLDEGTNYLYERQIMDYKIDAWYLLQDVCHVSRMDYLIRPDTPVEVDAAKKYRQFILRRGEGCPLQYITGRQEFMGIPFSVDENVLIPRQDTEVLVETVLEHTREDSRILDMCTGSGCILLSILGLKPMACGVGADLSAMALKVAAGNEAQIRGLACAPALPEGKYPEILWVQSDLYENISGTFDVIVSNPPYIPSDEIETLMTEVRCHEPRMALDGTADGLEFYRRIICDAGKYLTDDGMIFFEIGWNQAEAVCELLKNQGFVQIRVKKDLAGMDRVVYAVKG